jgi:formate-dependent nitrite reductase membrane component NrfD
MILAEHFVRPPNWEWYILGYFFFAGIAGGCYVLGTLLRIWGQPRDQAAARVAFLISFPALILCPILLTIDLGRPDRFWHMMVDTGPVLGLNFKYWSPMSVGVWGLLLFGIFSFVSFVESLLADGRLRLPLGQSLVRLLEGGFGKVFMVVGSVAGIYLASYTGVLLSVSNQPVWSDTWTLGGLFLVSGLSGSAAALLLATRFRSEMSASVEKIAEADTYFVILEAVLIALFLVTVGLSGYLTRTLSGLWVLLWLVVLVGLALPLAKHYRFRQVSTIVTALVVLAGVLALRAVVIFSAQY